jgi:PKD repeat protein
VSFRLPVAPPRYSKQNETEARRLLERAIDDILTRLTAAEILAAEGGTSEPGGPTAGFTSSISLLTVTFTNTSTAGDSAIASYVWDFGDGSIATSANPSHAYAAAGTYTVALTVTDENDLEDTFSADVEVEAATGSAPLLAGLNNMEDADLGDGPGFVSGTPYFTATLYKPEPDTWATVYATIKSLGMRVVLNLFGNPPQISDLDTNGDLIFSESKYEARVRRFTTAGGASQACADAMADAFATRNALAYCIDEPNHQKWGGSITPAAANRTGLLHKTIWPGSGSSTKILTVIRLGYEALVDYGAPAAGWTGFDYGWSQYGSQHALAGDTFAEKFAADKTGFSGLNMGMIPGLNFIDGGIKTNFDGVTACWNCGPSGASGILKGSYTGVDPDATFYPCGNVKAGENRFCPNPDWIRRFADVVSTDFDAPLTSGFGPYSGSVSEFVPIYNRSDMKSALSYYITTCAARTQFNGFRTPK